MHAAFASDTLDAYRQHRATFAALDLSPDTAVGFLAASSDHVTPDTAAAMITCFVDRYGPDTPYLRAMAVTVAGGRAAWIDRMAVAAEAFGSSTERLGSDITVTLAALTVDMIDEARRG